MKLSLPASLLALVGLSAAAYLAIGTVRDGVNGLPAPISSIAEVVRLAAGSPTAQAAVQGALLARPALTVGQLKHLSEQVNANQVADLAGATP